MTQRESQEVFKDFAVFFHTRYPSRPTTGVSSVYFSYIRGNHMASPKKQGHAVFLGVSGVITLFGWDSIPR